MLRNAANNPEMIARYLEAYVRQPELRLQHGAAGRVRVEAEFSIQAMVARYEAVYLDALRQRGRHAVEPREARP